MTLAHTFELTSEPAKRVKPSHSRQRNGAQLNRLEPQDAPVHSWYRFNLSYPPHLVRDYLNRFELARGATVLDPFCGTGTTLVECKKNGVANIGIEANPIGVLASSVKTAWRIEPEKLAESAARIADRVTRQLRRDGVPDSFLINQDEPRTELRGLSEDASKLLLANSISPKPLHKALRLIDAIDSEASPRHVKHFRLAFARAVVESASNLHFGPEVGVGPPKEDAGVVAPWLSIVNQMASDLRAVRECRGVASKLVPGDARFAGEVLSGMRVDAVITSPPYPNEKDYTRTTRLESVLLGFLRNKIDLRTLKKGLVRSNTRTVYRQDTDHLLVAHHPEVERVAREIERRRIEMGKTSGFERMYHRVTRLYFGGMSRHLSGLRKILNPGARLAYVVGDQASYLRVMIRTGQILGDIAGSLGYEVESIDLFRTRLATATKEQLREEVVVLRWPGERRRGASHG